MAPVLATKPEDLSSILESHMVEERNQHLPVILLPPLISLNMIMRNTHTLNKQVYKMQIKSNRNENNFGGKNSVASSRDAFLLTVTHTEVGYF